MSFFFYQLKKLIRPYFDFSKKETNGFLILMPLMTLILFVPVIWQRYYPGHESSSKNDKRILDSLVALFDTNKIPELLTKKRISPTLEKISLFNFNPNTISHEELLKLGLQTYLVDRITKYRSKGGVFKVKTDLKKIYGFSETQYHMLEPFIQIPATQKLETKTFIPSKSFTRKIASPLDLNLADSAQLEKVYGVGFKLASRIIKYRTKLGGFISMQQLKEVYGLDSLVLAEVNKKFTIDNEFIPAKININTADYETLKNHPYINYKFAKVIVSFKKQHGNFYSADQLKEIKIMTDTDIEKIKPYLTF